MIDGIPVTGPFIFAMDHNFSPFPNQKNHPNHPPFTKQRLSIHQVLFGALISCASLAFALQLHVPPVVSPQRSPVLRVTEWSLGTPREVFEGKALRKHVKHKGFQVL